MMAVAGSAAGDSYRPLTWRLQPFTTTIFATMSELAVRTNSVNLGQGFPDTDGPEELKEVAIDAIRHGRNQYPPSQGIPELRQAIATHQRDWYDLDLDPDTDVLVTVGATEGIAATFLALCEPGDEVVMFEPTYDSYAACASMAGAVPRLVRLHPPDWHFDPDELAAVVGPRTTMLLLNSPHNPTGKVFSADELGQVAALCRDHDVLAVTDEVYEHLVFDGSHVPLSTLPGMAERTLTISSGGKTFSFTGWKVGWVSGPAPLVAAVRAAKQFLTYTSPAPLQLAIARGLGFPPASLGLLADELRAGRDQLCDGLAELGMTSSGPPPPTSPRPTSRPWRRVSAGGSSAWPCPSGAASSPSRAPSSMTRPTPTPAGPWCAGPSASVPRCWRTRWAAYHRGPYDDPDDLGRRLQRRSVRGQPGGRLPVARAAGRRRMQSIAFELGIAETAYLTPSDDPTVFGLRWFSPAVEIDLCGHATLASAHALREGGHVDGTAPLTFHTRSGPLRASFAGDTIELDFPADPMVPGPLDEALLDEWPGDVVASGRTGFFTFVVLSSADAVGAYEPDLGAIAATGAKALLLTAAGSPGSGADYVLRVFGPNVGIDEDPATGAAQCVAGPYWAAELGRDRSGGPPALPARGDAYVRPDGDRVFIGGHATTVLTGELC